MLREGEFLEKSYLKLFDGERAVLGLFIVLLLNSVLVSTLLHCRHCSRSERIRSTGESEREQKEIFLSGGKWRNCENELKEAPQPLNTVMQRLLQQVLGLAFLIGPHSP